MINVFNGVMTGILMLLFIGICVWAWSRHNQETFDKMARLPLEDSGSDDEVSHNE